MTLILNPNTKDATTINLSKFPLKLPSGLYDQRRSKLKILFILA